MLEVGGQAAEGSGIEVRSGDRSAQSAEKFFAFIFFFIYLFFFYESLC